MYTNKKVCGSNQLTLKVREFFKKNQEFGVFLPSFLLAIIFFFLFPTSVFAGTITSISYGPSGSVVGTYVQASDIDFAIFTPATPIDSSPASTITLTFPSGTILTSANIAASDFTISQGTQGLCTNGVSNVEPSGISVNQTNRTITFTIASVSKTVALVDCGLGVVTIKTSGTAGGNEIQHPATVTSTDTFQVDTSEGGDTGSISTVSFIPAAASYLKVTGTASMTAGSTNELTITAYDQYDNVVSSGGNNYTGSKSLTFSGPANAPSGTQPTVEGTNVGSATSITFTNGVSNSNAATFIGYKAETTTVDASDGSINSTGDTSYDLDLTVNPASLNDFTAVPSTTSPTTDDTFTVILTARDQYQNTKTDYDGAKSVSWTWASGGSDSPAGNAAQKPANGNQTFTSGITGSISGFKLVKTETATINATADTKSGTSSTITTNAGILNDFTLTTQSSQTETAGTSFSVTVTARDAEQNTKTNYTGLKSVAWTWTATSSSGGDAPTKPADGNETFSSGAMTKTGFTLTDASETPTISITADTKSGTTASITVNPASANKLSFSTQPSSTATAGTNLTTQPAVTVQDQYGNTITGSSASITMAAVLASDGTTVGSGTLNATTNPLSATSGTATFAGVNYSVAESIKLKATATGLTQALSNTITISALTVSSVSASTTSSGATITWTTSAAASSKVDYGLTNSYGSSTTETDTSPRVTSHSVAISGLVACTTYHYRVRSTAAGGNETIDTDNTFTTTGCTGSATVNSQTASAITTASGGTVALTSGGTGATLTVPSSFAASDANFQIKQLDKTSVINTTSTPTGYSTIGNYIYDLRALSAVGTAVSTFTSALTVSIAYTASDISSITESTLKIYRWDGSNWNQLSSCTVDTSAKTVSCTTTAFSVFGLFGQASSSSSSSSSSSTSSSASAPSCGDTTPGAKAPWLYGAIAQDSNSVLLYFTEADSPVDKYVLQFGTKSGEYPWGSTNIGGKGTRTYLVRSLSPNTTYYLRIRAGNGCATGSWSNEISASTKARLTITSLDITESKLEPVSCTSSYKIKKGDTLWTISQKHLGSGANYKKIILANSFLNEDATLQIDQEIIIPCQTSDERDDTTELPKEEKQGYQLTVKVADNKGQAVAGAKVTLHSTVQEKVTDKDGVAVFPDAEKGDHRLIIAYKNYQGEQSINLQGDVKEFKLAVTVAPTNAFLNKSVLMLFGVLCVVIIFLLFRFRGKKNSIDQRCGV